MTPKLATAASIEEDSGLRRISRIDAAPVGGGVGPVVTEIRSVITFVSGRTVSTSVHVTSERPAATSQGTVSVSAETSLPAKSRSEDGRPEYRLPEDGPEEDERDAPRPALGRVHVTGGCADEWRHGPGRPNEREPDDHEHGLYPNGSRRL